MSRKKQRRMSNAKEMNSMSCAAQFSTKRTKKRSFTLFDAARNCIQCNFFHYIRNVVRHNSIFVFEGIFFFVGFFSSIFLRIFFLLAFSMNAPVNHTKHKMFIIPFSNRHFFHSFSFRHLFFRRSRLGAVTRPTQNTEKRRDKIGSFFFSLSSFSNFRRKFFRLNSSQFIKEFVQEKQKLFLSEQTWQKSNRTH